MAGPTTTPAASTSDNNAQQPPQPDQRSDALFPEDPFELLDKTISSNSVATVEQMMKIHTLFTTAGADGPKCALALAFACVDQGSSAFVLPVGKSGTLELSKAAELVRRVCTLRQFCMFYAKEVYNSLREKNRAPGNWVRKGFTYDTRFAAFDFFSGAYSAAAPNPPHSIKYQPSNEEITMHNKNAYALIERSRRQAGTSTLGVITAGQQAQQAQSHLNLGQLN